MNHPHPTPEQEFQSALNAYKQKDLPHAVFHLAYALESDPTNPQWRKLLDQIIKQAGDKASQLVQPDENQGMHYSHGAVLAYIQATQGNYDGALQMMSQVHGAIPYNVYLAWVAEWFEASAKSGGLFSKGKLVQADVAMNYILRDMQKFTSGDSIPDDQQAIYNKMLPVLETIRQQNKQHAFYHAVLSSLLRRIGHIDKALDYAMQGHKLQGHQLTALMVALVYREQQDFESALTWYKKTLTYNPTDVSVHLDVADMFIHMNRRADAIDYYRRATRLEPDQQWATPRLYYYSYFEDNDPEHLEDLKLFVQRYPENTTAREMYQRLIAIINSKPYVNYIPSPAEASINALQQIMASNGDKKISSKDFKLGLSMLESPSVTTVLEQYFRANGEQNPSFAISVGEIQEPDPRRPMSKVPFLLWAYQGTTPVRNLPKPSPKLAQAIGKIASEDFEIDRWRGLARQLASKCNDNLMPQLLAVMLYPPATNPNFQIWDWVYRVQLATALVIAYVGTEWENSERRKALLSLAFGPMDWTTDAGLFALAQLAQSDPKIAGEVVKVYQRVFDKMPTTGHISYVFVLTALGLELPSLPPQFRQQLEQLKQGWFN